VNACEEGDQPARASFPSRLRALSGSVRAGW
jgi:hypothetical protein